MGLNISLYRVIDMDSHQFTEDDRFDYIRYVGDVEFASFMNENGKAIFCSHQFCCDWIFKRPVDFEQTREWIRANIVEENQKRLLGVVDLMESEKDLWLYFGW